MMKHGKALGAVLGILFAGCGTDSSADEIQSATEALDQELEAADPQNLATITPEQALAADLKTIAESRGWTIEQATAHHLAAVTVGEVAEQLATARPQIFVGSAVTDDPDSLPLLLVKGPADDFVRNLVSRATGPIQVVDNQPFSSEELKQRQALLYAELQTMGYEDVSVAFDIQREGQLVATARQQAPAPTSSADAIARLSETLRDNVDLLLIDTEIGHATNSRGGIHIFQNSAPGNYCSTGFTVINGTGSPANWGVTTAGHCFSLDRDTHPTPFHTHVAPWASDHVGQFGDIEWHTTTSTTDDATFDAAPTSDTRAVTSVETSGGITVGESICFYSWQQETSFCNTVRFTSGSCDIGGGQQNMIILNTLNSIGGDSGSPCFWSNRAFGSIVGNCNFSGIGSDMCSAAWLYNSAIGKRVALITD